MRFDFTPFYRSSIGFDRLFDALEYSSSFPHHNIEKIGEDGEAPAARFQRGKTGDGDRPAREDDFLPRLDAMQQFRQPRLRLADLHHQRHERLPNVAPDVAAHDSLS